MNEWQKGVDTIFDWDRWWASSQKYGFNNLGIVQILTDDDIVFKMAIPGVDKENMEVTLIKDTIEVECKASNEFVEPFKYEFSIVSYNIDSLDYNLVNGVLTIKLEKKEELKPKKLKL